MKMKSKASDLDPYVVYVIPSSRIMHAAKKFKWEIIDHNIICSLLLDYLDRFDCMIHASHEIMAFFILFIIVIIWIRNGFSILANECHGFRLLFVLGIQNVKLHKLLMTSQWLVGMDF